MTSPRAMLTPKSTSLSWRYHLKSNSIITKCSGEHRSLLFNKQKIPWASPWCDRNVNNVISTGKMPSENTRHSRVTSSTSLNSEGEMRLIQSERAHDVCYFINIYNNYRSILVQQLPTYSRPLPPSEALKHTWFNNTIYNWIGISPSFVCLICISRICSQ